jgi:hypothetical protein
MQKFKYTTKPIILNHEGKPSHVVITYLDYERLLAYKEELGRASFIIPEVTTDSQ